MLRNGFLKWRQVEVRLLHCKDMASHYKTEHIGPSLYTKINEWLSYHFLYKPLVARGFLVEVFGSVYLHLLRFERQVPRLSSL